MNRRTLLILLLTLSPSLALFQGCSHSDPIWPNKHGKKVLATFAPLYCFAQNVAGDDLNVMCLLTAKGPHDATDSVQDMLKLRGADLVLANGLGLDEGLLAKLKRSSGRQVATFEVGEELEKDHHDLLLDGSGHKHAGDDEDHEHKHDPHIWLSPDVAITMVDIIADRLSKLEPSKKANFVQRATDYKVKLIELKAYGEAQFKDKKNRNIITQHDSMGYFAREFKLTIVGHLSNQEGDDVGTRENLVREFEKKRPAVLTWEKQRNKDPVEAMQASLKKAGIDTEIVEVDPIETAPTMDGSPNPDPNYYIERMRMNIDNLAKALK